MTHDLSGFTTDEPRFEGFTPTLDTSDDVELDPSFVFDFQAYDDLESDTQRWSTWLSVEPLCRGPEPRPDWVVTSQAADRHRARHPQDRQGGRRLPARARRARRAVRGDGGQALPRRGDPVLPPQRRLHRGPPDPALARRAGAGQEERLRPRRRRRPVGHGGVGGAQAALAARRAGPLSRADRRHRDPHGVRHGRRRRRAAAGPDPAGTRRCSSPTTSSSGRRWPSWPGTGWSTATSRRTTSSRRASGW